MKPTNPFILSLILILVIYGCARISAPKGGPVDETPPILLASEPDSAQINYKGNTITLQFDEWIKSNNVESNLIITPNIEGNFKTKVNKQSIVLTFQEAFQDSTTYTFNFGSAIQDITNSNIPPNLRLSFSTGPYIDSLEISGRLVNLYTQDPAKNTLISLYTFNDTLDITTGRADYFTKTDTAGNFKLTNLPYNQYLIYACLDNNNNMQAETDSELYGFYTDTLDLVSNISGIDFSIQRLNTKPLRVSSRRPYGKYFDIGFTKPLTAFSIQSLEDGDTVFYHQNKPDNVRLYNVNGQVGDTTQLIITAQDSIQTVVVDTVSYYFIDSKIKADPFTYEIFPNATELPSDTQIEIVFSKPVKTVNLDSVFYQLDSINTVKLHDSVFIWNKNKTTLNWNLNLSKHLKKGESLNLNLKPAAFISLEKDSSDLRIKKINLASLQETALIGGTITTNATSFIIQLLDPTEMGVIDEIYNQKQFSFQYVNAGTYQIRLIIDSNGNGKWDTGNILTRTPPEPVIYYFDDFIKTKQIKVRKNWEMSDIDITYNVEN